MTQREELSDDQEKLNWLLGLEKETLADMAHQQSKIIEKLQKAAKATLFTLPDRMDYEFHGDTVISNPFVDGYNQALSDVISMNDEYANSTGSDGWKLVPVEPTGEQWGGLARDIIFWLRSDSHQTPESLIEFLRNMGNEIPSWLTDEPEMKNANHVISKGTLAAIIYKAMLSAVPERPE